MCERIDFPEKRKRKIIELLSEDFMTYYGQRMLPGFLHFTLYIYLLQMGDRLLLFKIVYFYHLVYLMIYHKLYFGISAKLRVYSNKRRNKGV